MTWYVVEELPAPLRARVRDNLLHNAARAACPLVKVMKDCYWPARRHVSMNTIKAAPSHRRTAMSRTDFRLLSAS